MYLVKWLIPLGMRRLFGNNLNLNVLLIHSKIDSISFSYITLDRICRKYHNEPENWGCKDQIINCNLSKRLFGSNVFISNLLSWKIWFYVPNLDFVKKHFVKYLIETFFSIFAVVLNLNVLGIKSVNWNICFFITHSLSFLLRKKKLKILKGMH